MRPAAGWTLARPNVHIQLPDAHTHSLFHGALVMTLMRRSVKRYFTKAPRPTAAMVSGSQNRVAPSSRLVARSPRWGGP